jgi:hypothetical protein
VIDVYASQEREKRVLSWGPEPFGNGGIRIESVKGLSCQDVSRRLAVGIFDSNVIHLLPHLSFVKPPIVEKQAIGGL